MRLILAFRGPQFATQFGIKRSISEEQGALHLQTKPMIPGLSILPRCTCAVHDIPRIEHGLRVEPLSNL